jgi:flagellar biosynthesis/type III secretory pathway protein FliH
MQLHNDPATCKNIHELREWFENDYNKNLMGYWDAAELQRLAVSIYNASEAGYDAGYDFGYDAGYDYGHVVGHDAGYDYGYEEGQESTRRAF